MYKEILCQLTTESKTTTPIEVSKDAFSVHETVQHDRNLEKTYSLWDYKDRKEVNDALVVFRQLKIHMLTPK